MAIVEDQARFLRCIGEPTRLQILKLLAEGKIRRFTISLRMTESPA